jgi:hypothetical protein
MEVEPTSQHVTQIAYIATIQPDKSFKIEDTLEQVVPKAGCTVS